MSEYMFGVSKHKPTRRVASTMNRIAKRHGAYLVEANLPEGYQRWFCGPNRGEPFDGAMAEAVYADIEAAGIEVLP